MDKTNQTSFISDWIYYALLSKIARIRRQLNKSGVIKDVEILKNDFQISYHEIQTKCYVEVQLCIRVAR